MEIEELCKTEEGCYQFLRQLNSPDGQFECLKCGNDRAYKVTRRAQLKCLACGKRHKKPDNNDRAFKCSCCQHTAADELPPLELRECSKCKKQTSLKSGTFFAGVRLPLSKVFKIIIDFANGSVQSAQRISKEVGVSASTAYRYVQRARRVAEKLLPLDETTIQGHHSIFEAVLGRRSTETPPSLPGETLREHIQRVSSAATINLREGSVEKELQDFISLGFKAISRKQSQGYNAQHGFIKQRCGKAWAFLAACAGTQWISDKELTLYSSPQHLTLHTKKVTGHEGLQVCEDIRSYDCEQTRSLFYIREDRIADIHCSFVSSGAALQVCVQLHYTQAYTPLSTNLLNLYRHKLKAGTRCDAASECVARERSVICGAPLIYP